MSVCLCALSVTVTLVYCGQTVAWIKMKLGLQVGLGPGHIVLDWDSAPPSSKGHCRPQFSAHICCGKMAGWIKMPLGMEVGFGPGDCVRWGPSSPPKKVHSPPFLTHVYCGQMPVCIRIPLGTEEGLSLGDIVLDGDSAPHVKGHSSPLHFWPMFIVAKRLDRSRYHLVRT